MLTPARLARHPIHPMLVPLPIGLWIFSFVCDVASFFGNGAFWATLSWYAMAGGVAGALAAAVPGAIDGLSLQDPPKARGIALLHGLLNLAATGAYGLNLWMRAEAETVTAFAFLLSAIALGLLGAAGWLGGELVFVHGAGVQPRTNARGEPGASERAA